MTSATQSSSADRLSVAGIELEVVRRGKGRPVLLLHGFNNVSPNAAFLQQLGDTAEILAPTHPGFGRSARPKDFETVYDIVHLYIELINGLPHERLSLIGLSFGGWLAAELAVKMGRRIDKLVLADAVGIKVSDRETPDIFDVFNKHPDEARARSWHDAANSAPKYDDLEDDELVTIARNREALCRYGWHPYLYNPQLMRWLPNIKAQTLVLWGASDGIVKPSYGEAYAKAIPGARFEIIPEAGHHPEIEQPRAFAERVSAFLKR